MLTFRATLVQHSIKKQKLMLKKQDAKLDASHLYVMCQLFILTLKIFIFSVSKYQTDRS